MTDLVLDVSTQLSKRLVIAIRTENGVIAKPLCPTLLSRYFAIDDTLELVNQFDAGTATGTDILLFY
jgi:hypothetical protein